MAAVGCSQFGSNTDQGAAIQRWQDQQQLLARYEQWDISARALVRRTSEAYHIGIHWRRDLGDFSLLLQAPFGQGVFRIEASIDGQHRLRLPDGRVLINSSPEALLEDAIGWALPISGLHYWVRGLPHPGSDYSHRIDARGRARSITQDRWTVTYLDYFEPAEINLPRRLNLSRDELSLKLVIERWQKLPTEASSPLFPEFN